MKIICQSHEDDQALEDILAKVRTMYPGIEVIGAIQEDCVIMDCWGIHDVESALGEKELMDDDDEGVYKAWNGLSTEEKIRVLYCLERSIYSDDFYSSANSELGDCALKYILTVSQERGGEEV